MSPMQVPDCRTLDGCDSIPSKLEGVVTLRLARCGGAVFFGFCAFSFGLWCLVLSGLGRTVLNV